MLESKKSQQDLFGDNINVPKSYPEKSIENHCPFIYPNPDEERIMNMQSGTDYH